MPVPDFSALAGHDLPPQAGWTTVLTVYGQAQPKGSSSGFPYVDKKTGKMRVAVTSANDSLKGWEAAVRTHAQLAVADGARMLTGAVRARVFVGILRPPSASVKKRPFPVVKPDLDKVVRGLLDPLSKVLMTDDALVCSTEVHKRYIDDGPPYVVIELSPLGNPEPLPTGTPLLDVGTPPASHVTKRRALSPEDL